MAGSIVWVRRRNGSWWPGRILGPHELSASHLMSPRSGTPVKLLGREDASVDWYNLEKSKRVKAFRCGEFDDCIERAEASLGLPMKKREKYARREDAILHALELERQFLMQNHGKLALTNLKRENSSDSGRRVSAKSSAALENVNIKSGNHESYQLEKEVDVPSPRVKIHTPVHEHKAKDRTYPNLQGQNAEESHQMKGLRGFGLRDIPVNRMIHTSSGFDNSYRMAIDGHAYGVPTNDPCFENCSDSDSWNSISKGKRSLEGLASLLKHQDRHHAELADPSFQEDGDISSTYKNRQSGEGRCHSVYLPVRSPGMFDSHRVPQAQRETPTSKFDVANCHRATSAEETTSGSSEETESDSSETHSLEPHVEAGMMLSDIETHIKAEARTPDSSEVQGRDESASSDESHELSLGERPQFCHPEPNSSGFGVSKWLLKRKRNARNFCKRPTNGFSHRAYPEGRGRTQNWGAQRHSLGYCHDNDYSENDVDFIEGDFEPSTQGFVKTGYLPSQAAAKGPNFVGQNIIDWEELAWGRTSRGYCEKRSIEGHDLLIEVDLKVQANRQGEHVPWVSLMSRLNGKAIIGHPIQIEALEDGSTNNLVSTSDLRYGIDKNRVPPSWRSRKANPSQLEGHEFAENWHFHHSGKVRSKKSAAPNSFRSSLVKKASGKINPSSNTKTKTLSSIGYDQKTKKRRKDNKPNYFTDGAIKSVESAPPTVACIPVKLVFSRLLEAVGRASSGPAKHGMGVH